MSPGIWRDLAELLFPSRCAGCGRWGVLFCDRCVQRAPRLIPPFCDKCGRPLDPTARGRGLPVPARCDACRESPLAIDGIRAPYLLTGVVRKAIHDFKYRGVFSLAPALGRLLAEYVDENRLTADVVVPVPLHKSRRRQRGYDQAELLARHLSASFGLPMGASWLERVRPTAPQVKTTSAVDRRRNVAGAFAAGPGVKAGSSVLLIDDVCTTGATLNACAVALKETGVKQVRGLALAREA